ncbi:PAS domain S-box protein [Flagellimonas taeanensis]|nr:PAS domain S-box protein [Allomuricauda taeanensis]
MEVNPSFFKNCPAPVIFLDWNLCIMDFSDNWVKEFGKSGHIVGKPLFEVMSNLPEALKSDIESCKNGKAQITGSDKVVTENSDILWYSWRIGQCNKEQRIILFLEDITHRKIREDLLVKSQKVARIGGWQLDVLGNKVYWSSVTREILGVSEDFHASVESALSFYKEGPDRDLLAKVISDGVEKGIPWDTEHRIINTSGKEIWVRVIGEVESVGGKTVRLHGIFQDIDEKKRTELEYRKISERHMLATKKAGIGVWEYNIPDHKLKWDQNIYGLYGLKETDFKDAFEAWDACVHPDDYERATEIAQEAIRDKKDYIITFRIKMPSGEIRWMRSHGNVIWDDNEEAEKMIGITVDITDLKLTQDQLMESEESLHGVFENSSVGMALLDLGGKFTNVNESFCKSTGYLREELVGSHYRDVAFSENVDMYASLIEEFLRGEISTQQMVTKHLGKHGKIHHKVITVTVVKKTTGEISHFLIQMVDITPQIEAEKRLRNLLQISAMQNESLLNFAHIVSHNMRSHSANLTMITDFLLEGGMDKTEYDNTLDMLNKASKGLNETISHLNEVVQIKTGQEKKMDRILLKKIVNEVMGNVGALANEKKVKVEVDIPDGIEVMGITAYVESIVQNLLTNAIKYRDTQKKHCLVSIRASQDEEDVTLDVTDNGLGIDMEANRDKVFGMYKTFHRNKDAKGIGLFITKSQIDSIGGSIHVESEVGVGSTFRVKFIKAV